MSKGDIYNRPRQKREPDVPEAEVRVKSEGTEHERNRYIGRSDTAQGAYFEVSIEGPLSIPIRLRKIHDPPIGKTKRTPDRYLELNIGSVENARKIRDALDKALGQYSGTDDSRTDSGSGSE